MMRIIEIFDTETGSVSRLKLDGELLQLGGPQVSATVKEAITAMRSGLMLLLTTGDFYATLMSPEVKEPKRSNQKKREIMALIGDMAVNSHMAIDCIDGREASLNQQAACAAGKALWGRGCLRTWVNGAKLNLLRIK